MHREKTKRAVRLRPILLLLLLAAVLPAIAFAEDPAPAGAGAFDPKAAGALAFFAETYGWDREKMLAREWTGEIGGSPVRFRRQAGYQIQFLEDSTETTKLYLNEDLTSAARSGADFLVETARKEAGTAESPKGSGRIRYTAWYSGEDADFSDRSWDAVFVAWAADQCGFLGEDVPFTRTDSAAVQHAWLTGEKGFSESRIRDTKFLLDTGTGEEENDSAFEILPGDVVFRTADDGSVTHIGIVSAVTDRALSVIEGDAGDAVQVRTYFRSALLAAADPGGEADPALAGLLRGTVVRVEYPDPGGTGAGSAGTLENAKFIYRYLKGLGAPDAMIAGCLGNWAVESGIDPTGVEGIYDEKHTIGPRKRAAMAAPQSYTLFDLKPRTKIRVNWNAYRGRDGVFYPGIGLGGFTGSAATDLLDLAAELGGNWYDLEVQLKYCTAERIPCRDGRIRSGYRTYFFTGTGTRARYASMTASQAAYHFFHDWEGMAYSQYYTLKGAERSARAEEYLRLFRSW